MAQARRARRAGQPGPDAVLLAGSYSLEQKVTVEWEKPLALDEFEELLAPILAEPRSLAEIRTYVSGMLRERDTTFPAGRISKYLVSARSLRTALAAMVEAERLTQSEAPDAGAHLWSRVAWIARAKCTDASDRICHRITSVRSNRTGRQQSRPGTPTEDIGSPAARSRPGTRPRCRARSSPVPASPLPGPRAPGCDPSGSRGSRAEGLFATGDLRRRVVNQPLRRRQAAMRTPLRQPGPAMRRARSSRGPARPGSPPPRASSTIRRVASFTSSAHPSADDKRPSIRSGKGFAGAHRRRYSLRHGVPSLLAPAATGTGL